MLADIGKSTEDFLKTMLPPYTAGTNLIPEYLRKKEEKVKGPADYALNSVNSPGFRTSKSRISGAYIYVTFFEHAVVI